MLFYNDKGLPKGMALVGFQRDGDAALAANKYDGRFVDNSESFSLFSVRRLTCGVRTTVEGRSHRGQERGRSSEEGFCCERLPVTAATANVSIGKDESSTDKRPCPVRTLFLRRGARSSTVQIDRVFVLVIGPKFPNSNPRRPRRLL